MWAALVGGLLGTHLGRGPAAAARRDVLPHATLFIDHRHLHRPTNLMATQTRQRVPQQVLFLGGVARLVGPASRPAAQLSGRRNESQSCAMLCTTGRRASPTPQNRDLAMMDTSLLPANIQRVDRLLLGTWQGHANDPAVEQDGAVTTYGQLRDRALAMASVLQASGVRSGDRVAVHLERSVELVVALTGTMLAGGAHVALDVSDPVERVADMLQDCRPSVLVTTEDRAQRLNATCAVVMVPESGVTLAPRLEAGSAGEDPESPGYLVYTSGSTGRPKASLVPHRALASRLRWLQRLHGLTPHDRVLFNTASGFDVSVAELYWPLVSGACLVVARQGSQRDADYLADLVLDRRITTLHFVPSLLEMFLLARDSSERYDDVRRVLAGGEALSPALVARWNARSTGTLYNMYGPCECAIYSTAWACPRAPDPEVVLIGSAVDETELLVLDQQLQPVTSGDAGELFVGGLGVGLGYFDRPTLTAERFLRLGPDQTPFFRTGDLVREVGPGQIQFLGRNDRQVKIRGFRVELGEVEAVGALVPSVARVAVVATPEPIRLVAAVLPQGTGAVAGEVVREVRATMASRLPSHMMPTVVMMVDALPLTPNGKLDEAAILTAAHPLLVGGAAGANAPIGPDEQHIASVWCDILGLERVDRTDDLFEIGGDSLSAVKIMRRLRRECGVTAPMRVIFECRTIEALVAKLFGTVT